MGRLRPILIATVIAAPMVRAAGAPIMRVSPRLAQLRSHWFSWRALAAITTVTTNRGISVATNVAVCRSHDARQMRLEPRLGRAGAELAQVLAQAVPVILGPSPLRFAPVVKKLSLARTLSWTVVLACFLPQNAAAADTPAFQEQCASCHPRAGTLARRLEGESAEARSAALMKLLQKHHSDDAQTRAAIVEYLVGLSMQ